MIKKEPFQIVVKWDQCRGCRLCEMACTMFQYNVINPELSRIRVYEFYPGPMSIPITCSYCSDHPCAEVCPTGALYYDKNTFWLKVDKEKCLGIKCGACARACKEKRSNIIHFYPPSHDYAIVCDQCEGDPQCVKACPFDVLEYVPKILEGYRFADPPEAIAEDLAERWYPATVERRLKRKV